MEEMILKTQNLGKKYKNFVALEDVNITIRKGDICGLIGRNGAGKTTLMKIITTLTRKSEGSFSLFGVSDDELQNAKRRIGSLIENPAFFGNLTAYENLKYYAIQKGIVDFKQIFEALKLVDLDHVRSKKYKTFSLGMKQRLGIALAILDNPDFLILDEPINGLDPMGIKSLRETFKKLNEERNITILISSHILSELYLLANRFCFIDQGRVIKEISKEELDLELSKCIVLQVLDVKKAVVVIEKELKTINYKVINEHEIRLYDYIEEPTKVNKILANHDIDIMSLYESGISLEEYFETLIKEVK
ncbi:putative bacitracin ABC transporter ATP-binding protein BcrA [Mycoplasma sp. CAG:776]|nr:ATP-binding cassette domain-containing protein [Thomasclavelia sp.]CDF12400.1 putative bacitracin ABC transporter ATP-binding protein BcrA [Mycoplasma sp. CAG:776]